VQISYFCCSNELLRCVLDITRIIAVSDSYPHHCALKSGSKGKMCCGNCSVRENFLAKFEGYPAIIGIIIGIGFIERK